MRYWLHHDQRITGPFTADELRAQAAAGPAGAPGTVLPEGGTTWLPLAGLVAGPPSPPVVTARYHHVAVWKFIVLWVTTLGLYGHWWAWRCWRCIRGRDQSRIWPFWRGLFLWISLYPLLADLARAAGRAAGVREALLFLAALAFLAGGLFLPSPWWLLPGFLGFLPLLPAVLEMDRLNRAAGVRGSAYQRLRWYHFPALPAGALALALALAVLFTLRGAPDGMVAGEKLPAWIRSTLEQNKVINADEAILFFYSTDALGVRDDGNVLTDGRVLSWTTGNGDGEFELDAARFGEIEALEFTPAAADWDEAWLHVRCRPRPGAIVGGRSFGLYLSGDNAAARQFIEELRRRAPEVEFTENEPEGEGPAGGRAAP